MLLSGPSVLTPGNHNLQRRRAPLSCAPGLPDGVGFGREEEGVQFLPGGSDFWPASPFSAHITKVPLGG